MNCFSSLKTLSIGIVVVALCAWCQVSVATTFHVAPDGNDEWSGRLERPNGDRSDGPLASLDGARQAVRRWKAEASPREPVRVVIAGGLYQLEQPIIFTPEDSGTADCPITYEAAPGAKPVFSGGRRISGFKAAGDGLWTAHLPDVADGKWYFEQLFVDGRRATRARSPNKFYFYGLAPIEQGIDPVTGRYADLTGRAMKVKRRDLEPLLDLSKEQLNDTVAVFYHNWSTSLLPLAAVDADSRSLVTTGRAVWDFFESEGIQRYHLENFKAALDQPGEWFLDRDGTLYYKPLPGEDMTTAEVIAPQTSGFIRFAGRRAEGKHVEHITLKGLTFCHAHYRLPNNGHSNYQAAESVPAVVMANGAKQITIEDCEIARIGTYGIWFHLGCRDCRVERCYLHDLGAGGVRIGDTTWDRVPLLVDRTSHITVDNCIIRDCDHIFREAHGVLIGHSGDNTISHCEIGGFYNSAISVGWLWHYGPSPAVRNRIVFNHLHHLGQGVLSDMGGVYTLGESPGTVVANNVVHDVYAYDYGGWGLYHDESSRQIVTENNLVYNTKSGSFHQHFGQENLIRNNIFALSMDPQLQNSRLVFKPGTRAEAITFENNIVYYDTGDLLGGHWKEDKVVTRNNVYWDASGRPVTFLGMSLEEFQELGREQGSIVADPGFVDPKNHDFRLKPDSAALKLGFKPFDYSKTGVYGDPQWVALASDYEYPELEWAPEVSPPQIVDEDFEKVPVGERPVGAICQLNGTGDKIEVTTESPAGGTKCLRLVDTDQPGEFYNPHFFYEPKHTQGITRLSFDLKIGPGVELMHEWRDGMDDYKVGPTLHIADGTLQVDREHRIELPVGQWVHVDIRAGFGSSCTGTWDLAVTLPGQSPKVFKGLKFQHADCDRLGWLGFCSLARANTVVYLDNLRLSNTEAE